ncbi:hypothetical protein RHOSPDRAFT_14087, partial [Rhodotorula sp. JG-1b]
QDLLNRAKKLKNVGNVEFGQGRWQMAIESYREGLAELPDTRAHGRSISLLLTTVDTAALESKPDYVKAIHRRATANEAIGKWGSLQSALDDWNKLETLSTTPPSLAPQIKAAQRRLPEQIKVQQEKEKDEVLGKLKDLGNMVLGKFGLSTENFKLQEQPGGGYGLSFQQ